MLICDRFFLAKYSLEAFNALVSFGALISMLQIGANICACTADVFVGQLNGANKATEISAPTWQMIWFSLLTSLLFIPLALYLPHMLPNHLRADSQAIYYCRLLIAFNWLSPLGCALSTFFVGMKNTLTPLIATIVGNGVNFAFNIILIFGIKGLIPELGMQGAAIATLLGQASSILVLSVAFFSSYNRTNHHTSTPVFNYSLLAKILRVGGPNAIAQAAIAAAWTLFFILMQSLGEASLTLASTMQTIFGFFVFIIQGLSRGISTTAANLIGQDRFKSIAQVLNSGVKLCLFFCLAISLLLTFYTDIIVKLLFSHTEISRVTGYLDTLKFALLWGCCSFLFKSIRGLFSGLLTAGGLTTFVMINEVLTIWFLFILPVWTCIYFFNCSVSWAYFIGFLHNASTVGLYYWKFFLIDWKENVKLV